MDTLTTKLDRVRQILQTGSTAVAADVRLMPPWPEERVAAFEDQHRFRFPEEYRAFLTTVGSSGHCLSFELVAPGEPRGYLAEWDRKLWAKLLANIHRAFPFREQWNFREWKRARSGSPNPADFEVLDTSLHSGSLLVGGDYGGFDLRLIVTGEARGEVWLRGGDFFTQAGSFLTWFEKFLKGSGDDWGL